MMNEVRSFFFENEEIRTVLIDGKIWFVGKDIAKVLGYKDTDQALRKHVDEEDKLNRTVNWSGQGRAMIFVNESGLQCLVIRSKLPNAKKLRKWFESDVISKLYGEMI